MTDKDKMREAVYNYMRTNDREELEAAFKSLKAAQFANSKLIAENNSLRETARIDDEKLEAAKQRIAELEGKVMKFSDQCDDATKLYIGQKRASEALEKKLAEQQGFEEGKQVGRDELLDSIIKGLRSEDDSTQLRAIIASVESLRTTYKKG